MIKVIKIGLFNITVLIALVVIADLILWGLVPIPNTRTGMPQAYISSSFFPNQKFTLFSNEGLIGIDSVISFTTNNVGFRGDFLDIPKPDNEFRIFLVGGSTTECLFIDDSKSIGKQLQKKFIDEKDINVKVYNAGKSGDISTDHLAMLAHRINHLEPDLLILFSGINDFRRSIFDYNYIKLPQKLSNSEILKAFFSTYSQIVRRIILIKNNTSLNEGVVNISVDSNYGELINKAKSLPLTTTIPKVSTVFYQNNLKAIAGICKSNNYPLILVTQASTWNSKISNVIKNYHWLTMSPENKQFEEFVLDHGLERFNDVQRELANQNQIHLIDLANIIPKSEKYFYDDCHFNNSGVNFYSNLITNYIIENQLMVVDKKSPKN